MFSSEWTSLLSLDQVWFSGSVGSRNLSLSLSFSLFFSNIFLSFSHFLCFSSLSLFPSSVWLSLQFYLPSFLLTHYIANNAGQSRVLGIPSKFQILLLTIDNQHMTMFWKCFLSQPSPTVTYSQHVCTHIHEAAQSHAQIHVCDVAWRDLEYLSHHHIPFILVITR